MVIERNGGDLGFEAELFKSGETQSTGRDSLAADALQTGRKEGPPKGGFFLKRMTHRPAHSQLGNFAKFQKLFLQPRLGVRRIKSRTPMTGGGASRYGSGATGSGYSTRLSLQHHDLAIPPYKICVTSRALVDRPLNLTDT
jgi:hypothetical protein